MEQTNVTWHVHSVTRRRGCVVWFTGLSGSGKSTIANAVDQKLFELDQASYVLDGDNVRHGLNAGPQMLADEFGDEFGKRFGLGFSAQDRHENIRRIGEVSDLFCAAGIIVLTAFVSPYRHDRALVRRRVESHGARGDFVEVFVDTPLDVCEQRDPKGLYKKARSGEITGFTGIDDPYEPPEKPEIVLAAGCHSPTDLAEQVITDLRRSGKIGETC